jgi:hypothetical protein
VLRERLQEWDEVNRPHHSWVVFEWDILDARGDRLMATASLDLVRNLDVDQSEDMLWSAISQAFAMYQPWSDMNTIPVSIEVKIL